MVEDPCIETMMKVIHMKRLGRCGPLAQETFVWVRVVLQGSLFVRLLNYLFWGYPQIFAAIPTQGGGGRFFPSRD